MKTSPIRSFVVLLMICVVAPLLTSCENGRAIKNNRGFIHQPSRADGQSFRATQGTDQSDLKTEKVRVRKNKAVMKKATAVSRNAKAKLKSNLTKASAEPNAPSVTQTQTEDAPANDTPAASVSTTTSTPTPVDKTEGKEKDRSGVAPAIISPKPAHTPVAQSSVLPQQGDTKIDDSIARLMGPPRTLRPDPTATQAEDEDAQAETNSAIEPPKLTDGDGNVYEDYLKKAQETKIEAGESQETTPPDTSTQISPPPQSEPSGPPAPSATPGESPTNESAPPVGLAGSPGDAPASSPSPPERNDGTGVSPAKSGVKEFGKKISSGAKSAVNSILSIITQIWPIALGVLIGSGLIFLCILYFTIRQNKKNSPTPSPAPAPIREEAKISTFVPAILGFLGWLFVRLPMGLLRNCPKLLSFRRSREVPTAATAAEQDVTHTDTTQAEDAAVADEEGVGEPVRAEDKDAVNVVEEVQSSGEEIRQSPRLIPPTRPPLIRVFNPNEEPAATALTPAEDQAIPEEAPAKSEEVRSTEAEVVQATSSDESENIAKKEDDGLKPYQRRVVEKGSNPPEISHYEPYFKSGLMYYLFGWWLKKPVLKQVKLMTTAEAAAKAAELQNKATADTGKVVTPKTENVKTLSESEEDFIRRKLYSAEKPSIENALGSMKYITHVYTLAITSGADGKIIGNKEIVALMEDIAVLIPGCQGHKAHELKTRQHNRGKIRIILNNDLAHAGIIRAYLIDCMNALIPGFLPPVPGVRGKMEEPAAEQDQSEAQRA
jgi:hypothetical protein